MSRARSPELVARTAGVMVAAAAAFGVFAVLRAAAASHERSPDARAGGSHVLARAFVAGAPDAIHETRDAVPEGLRVEIEAQADRTRVVVGRAGHLVAIRAGHARAAGENWAAIVLHAPPRKDTIGGARRLVWETTDPATLETLRGTVSVAAGTADPPRIAMAPKPMTVAEHRGELHACKAHGDGAGGFSVLCKVDPRGRRVSVANVLGARTLEDVWSTSALSPGTIARLDLPLSPGEARTAIVTYASGVTGVVVRAEASWVYGEARPSLSLGALARRQPI